MAFETEIKRQGKRRQLEDAAEELSRATFTAG